jgi:hypothetical protein
VLETRGKTLGNTYIYIRKYQKMSGNTLKYQEIPVNFRKYQEILRNTRKYKYLGFFIDWFLNYFTLFTVIYEMSNRKYYEIPGNTRKYFSKNMKYQEIPRNTMTYFYVFPFLEIFTIFFFSCLPRVRHQEIYIFS